MQSQFKKPTFPQPTSKSFSVPREMLQSFSQTSDINIMSKFLSENMRSSFPSSFKFQLPLLNLSYLNQEVVVSSCLFHDSDKIFFSPSSFDSFVELIFTFNENLPPFQINGTVFTPTFLKPIHFFKKFLSSIKDFKIFLPDLTFDSIRDGKSSLNFDLSLLSSTQNKPTQSKQEIPLKKYSEISSEINVGTISTPGYQILEVFLLPSKTATLISLRNHSIKYDEENISFSFDLVGDFGALSSGTQIISFKTNEGFFFKGNFHTSENLFLKFDICLSFILTLSSPLSEINPQTSQVPQLSRQLSLPQTSFLTQHSPKPLFNQSSLSGLSLQNSLSSFSTLQRSEGPPVVQNKIDLSSKPLVKKPPATNFQFGPQTNISGLRKASKISHKIPKRDYCDLSKVSIGTLQTELNQVITVYFDYVKSPPTKKLVFTIQEQFQPENVLIYREIKGLKTTLETGETLLSFDSSSPEIIVELTSSLDGLLSGETVFEVSIIPNPSSSVVSPDFDSTSHSFSDTFSLSLADYTREFQPK